MNDRRPTARIREAPGCVQVFGLRCVSIPRPLRSQNGPITLENMNKPIIPGEILLEEYLKPMGISQNAMARAIGVAPRAINEIVLGRRSITPAMSIRFGAFFGQSDEFWHGIQIECDVRTLAGKKKKLTSGIQPASTLVRAS